MGKVMVCGVNGFVGKHLTRELLSQGHAVVGVGREERLHPELAKILEAYLVCDLSDQIAVNKLSFSGVDAVINLAGLAAVGKSFDNPVLYKQVNVAVLKTVCEALLKQKVGARIIAVSTGALYDPSQDMPLLETSKITASSPYAESKILMEEAAKEAREHGVECVVVRPFNHVGPGQEPGFLVPDLFQKIAKALASDNVLPVGKLTTKRDYTDVRDVVKAYVALALADKLQFETYNVCSGRSLDGETVLKTILGTLPNTKNIKVVEDASLVRPNDPPNLYGSHALLTEDTGWQPQIPFEQTIQDFADSLA